MGNMNLLDLDNDILNIIGDYVKKDNLEEKLRGAEQVVNGKKIRFNQLNERYWFAPIDDINKLTNDNIKEYLYDYLDSEFIEIKKYAKINKIKLNNVDRRTCFCILVKRCRMIFNHLKVKLNMEDENNFLDEYLTLKKLNLKSKKYSFNY